MGGMERHRPLSHPVVRARLERRPMIEVCSPEPGAQPLVPMGPGGRLPAISVTQVAQMGDRLDNIALLVAELPAQPLSVGQRLAAKCIAAELMRRATAGER